MHRFNIDVATLRRILTRAPDKRNLGLCIWVAWGLCTSANAAVHTHEKAAVAPGCAQESPQQCITAALEAMGGRERLQQVSSVRLQTVGHSATGGAIVSAGAIHRFL